MHSMNVSLSDELAAFVEGEVASGEYGTASGVVRDALRLLRRERAAHEERPDVFRLDGVGAGRMSARTVEGGAREPPAAHRARGA